MKKLLIALTLLLAPSAAFAQCNGVFANNTVCGNVTGAGNLPRPTSPAAFLGAAGGSNGQIQYNNASALGGFTMAGDCTASIPNITCTKTNGTPFTSTATTATGTSGATIPLNNGNNTFSGTTFHTGNTYFGNGRPWADIRSGSNSCAAAVGDGVTDDKTAIQCQLTFMHATYGGGTVYVPPGTYRVAGGVAIPQGVWLVGAGPLASIIKTTTDNNVITFAIDSTAVTGTCPSGGHYGGMEKLSIQGYQDVNATQDTTIIGDNCNVIIRDSIIWYGNNALFNKGVDSTIETSFLCGYANAVASTGANWYYRAKLDTCGISSTNAFLQGPSIAAVPNAENTFVNCDFSGTYTRSILIADTNNSSYTHFIQPIFSSPIVITNAKFVSLVSAEVGSTSFTVSNGTMAMSSSFALTSTTITGAGSRLCPTSANGNFTNC